MSADHIHGENNVHGACFACGVEMEDLVSAWFGRPTRAVRDSATDEYGRWWLGSTTPTGGRKDEK